MIERAAFWIAFPIIVVYGLIRDEIEFYKLVHHYINSKQLKDAEL